MTHLRVPKRTLPLKQTTSSCRRVGSKQNIQTDPAKRASLTYYVKHKSINLNEQTQQEKKMQRPAPVLSCGPRGLNEATAFAASAEPCRSGGAACAS
jgi:hypothetical protein